MSISSCGGGAGSNLNQKRSFDMSDPNHKAVAVIEHSQVPERVHPVVAAAMQQSPDAATLRELLAVQREWEANEARKAFTQALVDLKRDLPTVLAHDKIVDWRKDGKHVHYTHTSLAAAMEAITGPLVQYGFSLSWQPSTDGGKVNVTCTLTHSQGHSERTTLSAPPDKSGSKSDAQAIASTITLLQRYTALSLLGIATADMAEPEPTEENAEPRIDTKLNMKAVKALADIGYSKEQAEDFIGKPVAEWTTADVDRLRGVVAEIKQSKQKGGE